MKRWLVALAMCALSWGLGMRVFDGPARAGDTDPFAGAGPLDELDLARLAEEVGDALLDKTLRAPPSRQVAALAARAAPYARAPEALIVALAKLACGRDPALAPEAAQALLRIAEQLTTSGLGTREVLKSDLRQAREALACGETRPVPRADITIALRRLSVALDAELR